MMVHLLAAGRVASVQSAKEEKKRLFRGILFILLISLVQVKCLISSLSSSNIMTERKKNESGCGAEIVPFMSLQILSWANMSSLD